MAGQAVPDVLLHDLVAAVPCFYEAAADAVEVLDIVEDPADVGVFADASAVRVVGVLRLWTAPSKPKVGGE